MTREPLTRMERRVWLALKHFSFGKSYTIAKQRTMAEWLKGRSQNGKVCIRSIKRAMAGLKEKGWISTKKRGNSTAKKTLLGDPSTRSNKSGVICQMRFNLSPQRQNHVPSDVPSDVPSIHTSMEASPGSQPTKPTLLKIPPRRKPMSQMPEMYRGHAPTENLWRGSQRWIARNSDLLVSALDVPKIMELLEHAGYLELPEDAPLPAINWTPEATAKPATIPRKPMGIAESDLEKLRRQIEGQR